MKSFRSIAFSIIALFAVLKLSSCGVDPDAIFHQPTQHTSVVFDTLQGQWQYQATTYVPAPPTTGGNFTVVLGHDSLQFRPDLTGRDHYPLAPVNFTYQLLPDDSTLIFNPNPLGNPVFDTVTILGLSSHSLVYKTRKKHITLFNINGYYFLIPVLFRP